MITGGISAICVSFLLAKYLARKLKIEKANRFLMKLHAPLAGGLILLIVLHVIVTFDVWNKRHFTVIVSGMITSVLLSIMLISGLLYNKNRKKYIALHKMVGVLVLIGVLIHVGSYYIDLMSYQNKIQNTDILGVDLSKTRDGIYIGEYSVGYIYAKVQVEIKNKKINNIIILQHANERGKAAEKIINEVIKQQITDVDAVSGATNSSKVIIKAIENALIK